MSEPCWRCGARPDVDCGHRKPDQDYKAADDRQAGKNWRAKPGRVSGGGRYRMPDHRDYKPPKGDGVGHNFRTGKHKKKK